MAMLKFKKGLWSKLPETMSEGTIYVTTDEKAMYVDISDSKRIRLGDIVRLANMSELTPPYSTQPFYYIEADNALLKYVEVKNAEGTVTGHAWKQVNGTQDLQAAITVNANAISALDERLTTAEGEIDTLQATAQTHGTDIEALKAAVGMNEEGEVEGLAGSVAAIREDLTELETEVHGTDGKGGLVGKITALEAKDGEIDEAIEGVKTLLTQHETTANGKFATKDELTAAKSAVLGQTEGVDFVGTVKEAYAKIEAEAARADAAEKANASAASAAASAAADADAKAVQAGKDAAAADAKAVAANNNAETRLLKTDFQAFEITNTATIKAADDKAVAAGQAAAAAQSKADANETAIGVINGTGTGSISKAVADAEGRAAADATQKANTAEANAKAHADAEFVKTNAAVATAQSAAEAAQSAAEGAQSTANQAVLDAKEAKELAETKATLDDVKGLNYATKDEAQGYANAKDTAIKAAQSAAEAAQGAADLNTAAIAKLNGPVTEDGSVAKAVAGAVATAEAKATELAGAAETAAKGYADSIVAPVSQVANAAQSQANENKEAIKILNSNAETAGSIDNKIKVAKKDLTDDINSKINAANAMVYKGEVSSATELGALTNLSIGHTYVVGAAFGAYNAGDLLVANGTEVNNIITAESLTWDHVTTGYDADLEQTIKTVDGKIQLTSAIGADNGQIAFESKKDANNNTSALVVEVANNTVSIGMVWEEF